MSRLVRISTKAPDAQPVIRVYNNRCVLNKYAAELMGLSEDWRVDLRLDKDEADCGRDRIFIGRCAYPQGYKLHRRGLSFIANSADMRHILCEHLDGYGAYRICPEYPEQDDDTTYYNIFFRKYD